MKLTCKNVAVIFLAIMLCSLVWWLRPVKQTPFAPVVSTPSTLSTQQPIAPTTNPAAAFEPENNWEWTNSIPIERRTEAIQRVKKLAQIVSVANMPIEFYGRFVDQFNEPVPEVRVVARVNGWNVPSLIMQSAITKGSNTVFSDDQGNFTVNGMSGESLDLRFEKEGYELAPHCERTFCYGPGLPVHHVADPANPVVYHMWKWQGAAELIGRGFEKKVRADGTPISLDLTTGEFVIGATNLRGPTVRVWRDPLVFNYQTGLPNVWSYELIWPNGKIQPTSDIFCYFAPESGYEDKLGKTIRKGDPDYRFEDKQAFYFVNQQGQYGRGVLEILANRRGDTALVMLSVCWNPDGSRNLEPKPE